MNETANGDAHGWETLIELSERYVESVRNELAEPIQPGIVRAWKDNPVNTICTHTSTHIEPKC